MSDSTSQLDTISSSQAQKEVTANALFDAMSPAAIFGRRASTTSALTWGYYGGRLSIAGVPTSIANGTVALTGSTTNYVVASKATGAVSVSTATTNWNNTAEYIRLYQIVTGASSVTSYTDHRALVSADSVRAGDVQGQLITAATTGGSGSAFTLAPTPATTANAANQRFMAILHTAPSGSPTMAVSGQTALNFKYRDANGTKQFVTAAQAPSGYACDILEDGTDWLLLNPLTSAPPASTFASLPAASSAPGQVRAVTDLNNALLRSDGTNWNPVNGSAVIANAHNVNLTIQSLTEALITSVAFPAGFVRAGSRIRTWTRWAVPGAGTASRIARQRMGASGGGLANGLAHELVTATSVVIGQLELLNTLTALGVNTATRQSTVSFVGLHAASVNAGSYVPTVNFGNAWEIAFTGQSCAETAQTAVTATWAAGVATFAKVGHGYAVGDKIVNTLFDLGGYNATFIVASVPTADSWTAALVADPGGAGSGGSTSRVSNVTLVDYYVEWLQ